MPRIVVITTGGTIATSADPAGVLRQSLSGAELVEGLGTEVVDLLAVDSSELTPLDWLLIGSAVSAAATDGADGHALQLPRQRETLCHTHTNRTPKKNTLSKF
jgi:L-asparaginase